MKKLLSVMLILVMLMQITIPVEAAQSASIAPCYVNTEQATATLTVSDSGSATVRVTCSGNSNVTQIRVTAYIEKKEGTSWKRVNIGTTTNAWTYSTTLTRLAKSYTTQLPSCGEYRTVVTFVVTGTTSETITKYASGSY